MVRFHGFGYPHLLLGAGLGPVGVKAIPPLSKAYSDQLPGFSVVGRGSVQAAGLALPCELTKKLMRKHMIVLVFGLVILSTWYAGDGSVRTLCAISLLCTGWSGIDVKG